MNSELPLYNQCCGCLPLRKGLIVWGCFKVFISCVVTLACLKIWDAPVVVANEDLLSIFLSIAIVIASIDIILSIVLIIGCRKRNVKLLKKYYYHSKVLVALLLILTVFRLGITVYHVLLFCAATNWPVTCSLVQSVDTLFYAACVGLQIHITLVVKSEILRLENGCHSERYTTNVEGNLETHNSDGDKDAERNKTGVNNDEEIRAL